MNHLISEGETNAVIGSLACRSALKYGLEVANPFCKNPLQYVLHMNLTSQYDFQKVFVAHAMSLLEECKFEDKQQDLLVDGKQTSGNLFELGTEYIREMERIIRIEIEKYRLNFKSSSEGFLAHWPSEYSLKGWLISIRSGGKLKPHIHESGWLSGSVYINVPPKSEPNSGNLNVAIGEESDVTDAGLKKESLDVKTGSLVLFPASLTHYTTPFHSEQDRVVLAFDVIK